jgi:hypothetical protein
MHSLKLASVRGSCELVIGVSEKDEAEYGDAVFGRFQFGIGTEFVGGTPEAFFEFGCVGWHDRLCAVGPEMYSLTPSELPILRMLPEVNRR